MVLGVVDRREMSGRFDLRESVYRLLRYRYLEVELMEMFGGWTEGMVHIPVRVGMGLHMYEQAVNADLLSWRLFGMKSRRMTRCVAPSDEFVRLCERIWLLPDAVGRIVGAYRVLKPHLVTVYRYHAEATDPVADAATVRTLRRLIDTHESHLRWAQDMFEQLAATPQARRKALDLQAELETQLVASGGITARGAEAWWLPHMHDLPAPEGRDLAQARAEAPGRGELRSAGYTYRKVIPVGTGNPFDSRFRYYADAKEEYESAPPVDYQTEKGLVRWLHNLFWGENDTVDRMGRVLSDFPDLPWKARVDFAQQAWEEARHIEIGVQLIQGLGGHLGMYPFQADRHHVLCDCRDVAAHMAAGNVFGEGGALTATNKWLKAAEGWGNSWLTQALEHLSADEVVHVGFGQDWFDHFTRDDPARRREAVETAKQLLRTMVAAGSPFGASAEAEQMLAERLEKLDRHFLGRRVTQDPARPKIGAPELLVSE